MWIFKHLISCCYISKDSLRQFCSLFHVNLFFNRKESQRAGQTLVEGTQYADISFKFVHFSPYNNSVEKLLVFSPILQQMSSGSERKKKISQSPHLIRDKFQFLPSIIKEQPPFRRWVSRAGEMVSLTPFYCSPTVLTPPTPLGKEEDRGDETHLCVQRPGCWPHPLAHPWSGGRLESGRGSGF